MGLFVGVEGRVAVVEFVEDVGFEDFVPKSGGRVVH